MKFNFVDLTQDVRSLMLSEVEYDIKNSNLYFSKRFSLEGQAKYLDLLKASIENGTEESLGNSLNEPGFFNHEEIRITKKGAITAKVPEDAPFTFSEGEFNRFYMRGVCLEAIQKNKEVEVYRAKDVTHARSESQMKIGQKFAPTNLLEDLRKNVGVDTALGLPPGPNSGLTIKIV